MGSGDPVRHEFLRRSWLRGSCQIWVSEETVAQGILAQEILLDMGF